MKFLLYLFFTLPFILHPLKSQKDPHPKDQLFNSFCNAVSHNDLTKVLEIAFHHKEEVEAFINNPHTSSFINSASLHYAAFAGNKRIMEILLAHGADPFQKNSVHFNAFNYAKQSGKTALLDDAINEIKKRKSLATNDHSLCVTPFYHTDISRNHIPSPLLSIIILFAFFLFYVAQMPHTHST